MRFASQYSRRGLPSGGHERPSGWPLAVLIGLILTLPLAAQADQFRLSSGGTLHGERKNKDADESAPYVIELASGGTITLEASTVREWRRRHSIQDEYEERARNTPQTPEAQWELAEWCRGHGLEEERLRHLHFILLLDKNHQEARHALGYMQLAGQWVHPDRHQQDSGYVRYRGKWRTAQEIQLIREREERENANRTWRRQLERWRADLVSQRRDRAQAARDQFEKLKDPYAIDPLTELILRERSRPLKIYLIRVLANMPHDRAVHQLIFVSLVDRDFEVFHECVNQVVARNIPSSTAAYVQVLKNIDNDRVNRAAYALGKINDPQALGPLIEALQTPHTIVLPPNGPPGGTSATFLRPTNEAAKKAMDDAWDQLQGSGFSTSHEAQTIRVLLPNQQVLEALVDMSGVSFGYDQAAWRRWHAAQRQRQVPTLATRRDEP